MATSHPESIKKEAICRVEKGEPKLRVAIDFGIPYNTVRLWTRHVKNFHRKQYDEKTKKEAISRVSEGKSCREVSRSMGISLTTVRVWVKEIPNIQERPGWEGIRGKNLERLKDLMIKGYFFSERADKTGSSDSLHTLWKYVPMKRVQMNRRTIYFIEHKKHEAMEEFVRRWGKRIIKMDDYRRVGRLFGVDTRQNIYEKIKQTRLDEWKNLH